ncbi:hypothetical protein AU375_06193 [Methylobacterium radiotolerans]|nr:hypothetical protein AU375_06193 [Methylobacterium radiotolerans]
MARGRAIATSSRSTIGAHSRSSRRFPESWRRFCDRNPRAPIWSARMATWRSVRPSAIPTLTMSRCTARWTISGESSAIPRRTRRCGVARTPPWNFPGGHRLAEPARDRVTDLAARALAHDRSPVLDAVAESADGLRTPGRTRSRARRRSGPWRTARPRGGETLPLRVGPTPLSPSRPGYPSPSRRRRGSKPDRPVGHGCHAASHARHRRFVNQWIDYPTPLRRPLSRAAASCRRKDVREANMQMESVGGGVVMDPGPGTLPHFDLFARTLGDIDSPETMAWWSDPDWRGHVALAVITERGSARIASSSVILGGGRQAAPTAGSGDAGDRRAFLRREVERQRSASRSAIDRALAGLAFRPDGATFHVTSAFALRTVKAHLDVGSGWAGGTVRLGRETALRAGGGAASRSVPGVGDGHACGARAVDALADDLATWLERQYFHDDWNPDDTSQAALSHALAVMVAAHNGEISDSFAIGRAGSLPAPRSSAGGETGARSRLSDHHATGRAVTPLEPLA